MTEEAQYKTFRKLGFRVYGLRVYVRVYSKGDFPKIRIPYVGVLKTRILLFRVLY